MSTGTAGTAGRPGRLSPTAPAPVAYHWHAGFDRRPWRIFGFEATAIVWATRQLNLAADADEHDQTAMRVWGCTRPACAAEVASCPACGDVRRDDLHHYDALAPEHCAWCAPSSCWTCTYARRQYLP